MSPARGHARPPLDLRGFLADAADRVRRIERPIRVRYEVTALQHKLWRGGHEPVLVVDRPRQADGGVSLFRALTNLTASRELVGRALGLSHHRHAAVELSDRAQRRLDPVVVPSGDAPVKQVIARGGQASLAAFPVFTQHVGDPGPYLSAAHATTYDPESGVDNTAIQRVWCKPGHELPFFPYPASHNRTNILKFWERGEAAPIAFWIGHHPAVSIGAQAKLGYPESHWGVAGALAGQPVRLVASEIHGERILVPADAELVLEGHVPPNRLVAEGPFGEYTGYAGEATKSPVFVLECLTHRRDALYHDCGSGLPDALVPDDMLNEARLYAIGRAVTPAVLNVHLPTVSRRLLAIVQVGEIDARTARELLRATLGYRRVKTVVLVGPDIDPFDRDQVDWAIATRVQIERDGLILSGLPGSLLDPSLPLGEAKTSKLGIDATWTGGRRPPVNRVPEEVWRSVTLADFLP